VPAAALEGRKLAARTGGVPVRLDIAGTLELALRLRPDARRVLLVGGTAEFDRNLLAVARSELGRLAGRLQVDEVVGSTISRLLSAVEKLPPDSFVLYISVFRDGAGMPQVPREVLRQVAAAANAPVFGIFETYLGEGIVAGSIASYETQGRRAGELVARVLEDPRAAELGVLAPVPASCVADWRLLQRWGLDERRLPEGCEVRFREPSAWQLYRWHILGALVVILLQGALIVALVVQRQRRRWAELAVQRHRMELAHAGRLATAGELTAAIAHEVNQPLGAILANVDAAEMLLDSGKARPEELRQILADLRRDDLRASEVIGRLRALLARQEMAREPCDLNAAVAEVSRLLEAETRRRHAALAVELDDTLPQVLGDRVHLQQVLLNLIINAMDAMADTAAGERRVLVRTARDGHGGVEVSVADRGPGIAPDRLPRLFESFYTTKKQGMGLGLSIARSIVEAHGGRIWAESGERGGATFRFTLPPAPAAKLPLRGG
jgi:signal transduction histidine kinase